MDFLNSAYWIRAKKDYGDICPIFQKHFNCSGDIKKASLYITAMGVYEATLNDKRVGDFIMAPGWTQYDKRHQYQIYDITALLRNENTLNITVGKGWYRGEFIGWREKDIYGGLSAVIAAIEIEYTNGRTNIITTDKSWKVTESAIRFSEIYDGETYDATFIPKNWDEIVILQAPKSNLILQDGCTVTEQETLLPINMFRTPKGELVIDFGQNMTGYISFEIDAEAGERLVYSHAEVLDSNGNFYTENLRTAKQKVEYICKDGKQTFKPHHTFMGFRYIRLDEAPANIQKENFKAIVVHSDMKRTGYFKCSNEKVNKLFSNIIWGQKGNFLDIPTDCPQRDERMGWTGDAQVFIETASYNFDVQKFFKKWLRDLAAGQDGKGGVPVIVPITIDTTTILPSAAWGDAAVICPWQIYLTYNDKEVLEEQLNSMIAWIEYMHHRGPEEFLWVEDVQFGDWLGMDAANGSFKGASDQDLIASAYYAYSTGIVVKALKVLGKDATYYEKLHKNVVKAFQNRYDNHFNTQTECAVALYFNLTLDRDKTAAKLAELVKQNENKLTTGFVGTPYLLHALSQNGYSDLAYTLLLQEEFPSWLFSVNMGATTVWEHWDSLKSDGSMWNTEMNSFNHYAYGSVAAWMYKVVAGIQIDENNPGFNNVILCPVTDDRLTFAEAIVETAYGTITSKWEIKNGKTFYEFNVPNKATLILNGEIKELSKGFYKFEI
ncbi:MAG: family 78 glycoside hydrolase catalytic domain [Clostridia bacterium]|nr:family 78 glycoside hydrolase catalytic domain [Clostridia bacterium]